MILIIASAIIVSIVVILIGFVLFGIIYKPKPTEIFVDPREGELGKFCTREPVKCSTVADCDKICNETGTIELECVPVNRYNAEQVKLFGKGGSYCLPKQPSKLCSAEHGGVWAWSGYAAVDHMEWDCLCMYPGYYGDEGCQNLNAGICSENPKDDGFKWDATAKGAGPPGAVDCKCPEGTYQMVTQEGQVPKCIPNNMFPNYYKSNMQYPIRCSTSSECQPNHICNKEGNCVLGKVPSLTIKNNTNAQNVYIGVGKTAYFVKPPQPNVPDETPPLMETPVLLKGKTLDLSKYVNYVSIYHNYVAISYGRVNNYPLHKGWVKLGEVYNLNHQFDVTDLKYTMKNSSGTTFWWGILVQLKTKKIFLPPATAFTKTSPNFTSPLVESKPTTTVKGNFCTSKIVKCGFGGSQKCRICPVDITTIDTSKYYVLVAIYLNSHPILIRPADIAYYIDLFSGKIVDSTGKTGDYSLTGKQGTLDYIVQLTFDSTAQS